MSDPTKITPSSTPLPDGWRLGDTSESYESSGRGPGTISSGNGDAGGQSYGNWQLSSNEGTLKDYLQQARYKDQFKGLELGSDDFNAKWREVAKADSAGFQQDQYNFIKASHFDKQAERLKASGLDLSTRGAAVQDALWSTSVQYRALTKGVFEKGMEEKFGKSYDLAKLSDKDIVTAVQDYKIGHNDTLMGRNSGAVKASVKKRAEHEKAGLLSLTDGKVVHRDASQIKSPSIADKRHPGHTLYEQALHGLQKWNHDHHIRADPQGMKNAAGALAAAGHQEGFKRIDLVEPTPSGDQLIALQGNPGSALAKVIAVQTMTALNTSLAQSSQAFSATPEQEPGNAQTQQHPPRTAQPAPAQQAAPSMAR